MLPDCFACSACGERFDFATREAVYDFGRRSTAGSEKIHAGDLFEVPVRPAWCKDCATVCIAEDIASLRAFENACGAVRAGSKVDYPVNTESMDAPVAMRAVESYLRWRMDRRHKPRALCCGGANFQFMDVAIPLLKHQECEFGFVEPRYIVGGVNRRAPGIASAADIRVCDGEGELVGRLTWFDPVSNLWTVVPARYPQDEGS